MELTAKENIRNLLIKYKMHPSKRLGQNFLINKLVLKKIIQAANLKKKDVILEIGPGIGTLTKELAKKSKRVIAIEKDKKMLQILKETLKGFNNIEIIHKDILKIENSRLKIKNYKMVSNLPYYAGAPIIRKFLEAKNKPRLMILMLQKEVAQRICAKPPKMGVLTVSVQFYAKPKIVSFIPRNSFWPQPKVDSAIIKLKVKKKEARIGKKSFFKIVKAGFLHPRKQIVNNLSKVLKLDKRKIEFWLLENKIKPIQRAESLLIKDWVRLTKNFKWKIKRQKKKARKKNQKNPLSG